MLLNQNILLKRFDEWQKSTKKSNKCRDGPQNTVIREVGLRHGALGSQANTI